MSEQNKYLLKAKKYLTKKQTNISSTFIATSQVMAIGAMVKSALEIDEETKIQFHVHREEKHKLGAGSQKIFI